MKKMKQLFLLLTIPVLLMACIIIKTQPSGCIPPPEGFSEVDLVGTWIAQRLDNTDMLIIKENGTYKQIIHIESPTVDYESNWQTWRIEYGGSGIPYLYMDGLRMCVYLLESDCGRAGSDGGAWWDFCEKEAVDMPSGGGVLIVLGVSEQIRKPSRDTLLMLPIRFTDAGAWTYELQEP